MADRKLCVCGKCHRWFSVNAAFTPKQCGECNGMVHIVDVDYNEYSAWDETKKSQFRTEYEKKLPHIKKDSKQKKPGRACCTVGAVLSLLYAVYLVTYFGGIELDNAGYFLASVIVAPHMICVVVAAIFSLVGLLAYERWPVLTAAILMAVAAALFPRYAMFVIVQSLLLFVAYARMLTPKKPA